MIRSRKRRVSKRTKGNEENEEIVIEMAACDRRSSGVSFVYCLPLVLAESDCESRRFSRSDHEIEGAYGSDTDSPPFLVKVACQVAWAMLLGVKDTLPSHMETITPPG